ncbi:exodeoxyribonuclease III [Microbacterium azadirachtae]|uniref:Exodeoxyribonuclease III n=1 Tax=Microbacterium azadirachtae TaxID=582680 RepID=A0A0F0KY39_9MICO|nr:exodeoxyribonuclease III [Microbacterium azadirachtae]KJL25788.1 Exodeoxyribonuclease III [Microbacterium azadirachtae]UXW85631.1 exodeoxyribonuclease III [Microbacterium azadirachtae]SDM21067.1 exodeoxyribonuclease-3 [Microbacterium azadirachtae]SEG43082.1 exodeoxyribonuclease-3 [Microbacterium azadirachtae]SEG46193.1 exodeoxyribonuclease-3 [Microbacterium azadirachtae]
MRLATWNVNSIRTRVARTVEFAVREDIDVLAMQEIKCKPEQFPYAPFEEAGYHVEVHGLNQWNGVAIASREPMTDVRTAFDGMPGFAKGHEGPDAPQEARAIGAIVNGVRVWSLYVPNGRSLDDPHLAYKLHWLEALRTATAAELAAKPGLPLALVGDFNIIPFDHDNGDPDIVVGKSTHVSPEERAAFFALESAGVQDVVRPLLPEGYTYWDYQRLKFPRNEGIRIDFVLGSTPFADAVKGASIHREERKGEQPSDHVPVVVDLELGAADEDDDLPMIFA